MDRLFNMDNKFFTVMGRVADLIMLNVVFLICCLPIVTIGASLTALHYVTLKMARNEESYIIRSFFKSFKQNFKQATVINLIMLAVAAILYMDLRIVGNISGTMSQVLYIVFFAFGILYMMVFLYIYPVLAKFYNSIKNTFRNAFLMAIRHLPYTVLMAVITLLPAGVPHLVILCDHFLLMKFQQSFRSEGLYPGYLYQLEYNYQKSLPENVR